MLCIQEGCGVDTQAFSITIYENDYTCTLIAYVYSQMKNAHFYFT